MILFSEEKNGHLSTFKKTILDEHGNEISVRKVSTPLFQINKDNFIYFVLYNDQMKVIHEVYEYLNFEMRERPLTSRSKAAFALRLLYCFTSLMGITIRQLNEKTFKELLYFLRGISSNPKQYSMQTQRSASTVNGYLSVYRSFFASQHIKCESLFKSHSVPTESILEGEYVSRVERKRYDNNLRTNRINQDTVPKYIGPEEFKKLYKLALDAKDKQAIILMHLMYGYGLRLGECLGLTIEDIQEIRDNIQLTGMTPEALKEQNISLVEGGRLPKTDGSELELVFGNLATENLMEKGTDKGYWETGVMPEVDVMKAQMFLILDSDAYYNTLQNTGGTAISTENSSSASTGGTTPTKAPKKYVVHASGRVTGDENTYNAHSYNVYCDITTLKNMLKKEYAGRAIPGQPTTKNV